MGLFFRDDEDTLLAKSICEELNNINYKNYADTKNSFDMNSEKIIKLFEAYDREFVINTPNYYFEQMAVYSTLFMLKILKKDLNSESFRTLPINLPILPIICIGIGNFVYTGKVSSGQGAFSKFVKVIEKELNYKYSENDTNMCGIYLGLISDLLRDKEFYDIYYNKLTKKGFKLKKEGFGF